jgi:hypothetical protein
MTAADPTPPPVEPPVEKPKRNWRGFLKEYAIIVIGVLTALAAQQAAEWLHWQGEVKAARKAIHAEMANNNGSFARRIDIAHCLKKQAGEAERTLNDLETKRPPGRFTIFHPGNGLFLSDSEWQSERSAQSLTHFPREELALMGRYYAQKGRFEGWIADENAAWQALGALRHPPKDIAAGDLLRLRAALGTVRETERSIVLNATRELNLGRQLGIPITPNAGTAEKFCTLDDDAFIEYLQSLEQR